MTLVAVPIHGLPEIGKKVDPLTQLDPLLAVCKSQGLTIWDDYRWASDSVKDIGTTLRLLKSKKKDESFTATHAKGFSDWIRPRLQKLPDDTILAIMAFSAGGAIFYRWICEEADIKEIQRVSIAIILAAPHTFPTLVYLENRKKPIEVNEETIPPVDIVKKLTNGNVRLRVLLGGGDITIPPVEQCSIFPPSLGVDQEVIPYARHSTICKHRRVIRRVKAWIS